MENKEIQEEMFRAMFRLKHLNMSGMLKDISIGEYKILEMCAGCPACNDGEDGAYVSGMQPKCGFQHRGQSTVERHGGEGLYCPSGGCEGPAEYPGIYYGGRKSKAGRMP